jgi:hypothetical protein
MWKLQDGPIRGPPFKDAEPVLIEALIKKGGYPCFSAESKEERLFHQLFLLAKD